MPGDYRRPHQPVLAGLRTSDPLPVCLRLRHPAGCRQCVQRGGGQSFLRFAAGQSHRPRSAVSSMRPSHGPLPTRISRAWREDQHPVPDPPDGASDVLVWRLHHAVHRRDQGTDASATPARSGNQTADLLGEIIVNGNATTKGRPKPARRIPAPVPAVDATQPLRPGTRDKLRELGPTGFANGCASRSRC